ncbi:P-loop containing nucleoside triphosphate hydrolase protein [Mycena vulgaris]|nr:P-loop containing nucleoside triphosphate hydrolase protein [Mycena vulgaris]
MDPLRDEIPLPLSQSALDAFRALPRSFMTGLTAAERLIALDVFLFLDLLRMERRRRGSFKSAPLWLFFKLLSQDAIVVTISPLRLIQDNHVAEFSKYGIPSIAINCYTPDNPASWNFPIIWPQDIKKHSKYRHYTVSPEQCGSYQGHIPRFAKLLHDPKWAKKIKLLQLDEAHFIATAGQAKGKEGAFRPSYSDLGERVRVHLSSSAVCTAYSASMPTRIVELVMKTMRMDPNRTVKLELTTNRPNLVYATIVMVGNIDNFANLDFLVPQPLPPNYPFPKFMVFIDDKKKAAKIARYLNSRLPPEKAALEPFKHYHSSMSKPYLEDTARRFKEQDGDIRGLIATESASNGFDVLNIRLVVLYGVPKTKLEEDQRGGRGGRDGLECLVLTIAEKWAFENLAVTDPDHKPCKKEERTEKGVISDASSDICRRYALAVHTNDNTPDALDFSGRWCCDNADDDFDISVFLPGPLLSDREDSEGEPPVKKPRRRYRPVPSREPLESALEAWRTTRHARDPIMKNFPITFVLAEGAIKLVARELAHTFRIPRDLTSLLDETDEWHSQYALEMLTVIRHYDMDLGAGVSSDSDSEPSSGSQESDSDLDDILQPTEQDRGAVLPNSTQSSPSNNRANTPEPTGSSSPSPSTSPFPSPSPSPAPRLTASGRPLRQAAVDHSVSGIAEQVAKRQKITN